MRWIELAENIVRYRLHVDSDVNHGFGNSRYSSACLSGNIPSLYSRSPGLKSQPGDWIS